MEEDESIESTANERRNKYESTNGIFGERLNGTASETKEISLFCLFFAFDTIAIAAKRRDDINDAVAEKRFVIVVSLVFIFAPFFSAFVSFALLNIGNVHFHYTLLRCRICFCFFAVEWFCLEISSPSLMCLSLSFSLLPCVCANTSDF